MLSSKKPRTPIPRLPRRSRSWSQVVSVWTNPCFCPQGISLEVLREFADQLNIPWDRVDISPEEFAQADEAFLTSTSVCMLPIVKQNGRPLGSGTPSPIFYRLLEAWSNLVGLDVAGQAVRVASSE